MKQTRHERKMEMIKRMNPFDSPNGSTMPLDAWWFMTKWYPPFEVFDVKDMEWKTVDGVILLSSGHVGFLFEGAEEPEYEQININNWRQKND